MKNNNSKPTIGTTTTENEKWQVSDLKIYDKYCKTLKAIKKLNPIYVLTFDSWIEEVLPELNTLQRARILLLTNELNKKFTNE